MAALPLASLETQPVRVPVYRNERLRDFRKWFLDNQNAIAEYYNQLKPYCEEGIEPLVDFFTFCAIQHEREELKLQESDVVSAHDADSRSGRSPSVPGRAFSVIPFTPKGRASLAHIQQVLGPVEVIDEPMPHGYSL